ncbi:MAG: trypsin-like peptidase domain-containing protein [bacterium]|nr:trypsin-like peptidase domain-containing protein [bacterium]
MFSRAGIITISTLGFLVVWAGTVGGALAIKERLIKKTPEASEIKKPFAFAEPTEEEIAAMMEGGVEVGMIAIPMNTAITVFSCAGTKCAALGTVRPGEDLLLREDAAPNAEGWIAVEWNDASGKAIQGFVNVNEVAAGYEAPPPPPPTETSLDPETIAPQKDTEAEPVPIDPQTLVGIACDFESDDQFRDKKTTRGSGAIITEDGYVLTARSVVDLGYLNDGLDNFKLKQCYVGQLPASDPLPSVEAIRKINAFVRIPYLSYLADVSYIPEGEGASDYENAWMDFALLKLSDVNPDARWFGGPTHMPESFPAAPFLISELPKIGDPTLNFSFPSGTTIGHNDDVKTLFMQGLISSVTGYWAGDKRYAETLFLIESHLDTEDTAGGRFGSPIFWKGYVVGVHTAKQQASRQIYNVSAKAVLENLFDNQFIVPIDVR